jgi:hypothetical protein
MSTRRDQNRELRTAVFEGWAALVDREGEDIEPTPGWVEDILDEIQDELMPATANTPKKRHGWRANMVVRAMRWLTEPGEYSPFIDKVALRRAIDFDWPVIERLSGDERDALGLELATHPDPWGDRRDLIEEVMVEHASTKSGLPARPPSGRRVAWLGGSEAQRNSVSALVEVARRELAEARAA